MFYLPVATGALFIRPTGGVWSQYLMGTGAKDIPPFTLLEINNPGTTPVTFQIVAGSAEYTDRRTLPALITPTVPVQTEWSVENITEPVSKTIQDQSGSSIVDANGNSWLAIKRLSLRIQSSSFFIDDGVNYPIWIFLSFGVPVTTQWVILPFCSLTQLASGNYYPSNFTSQPIFHFQGPFNLSAAPVGNGATTDIAGIVIEEYLAVQAGFFGTPPG